MNTSTTPNTDVSAANGNTAVPSLDSIAQKMAAMRNQVQATRPTATGQSEQASSDTPVAPNEPEVTTPQAEQADATVEDTALEAAVPEEYSEEQQEPEVSESDAADTTAQEIIDFVDFAESNPNAKFKFTRNGKEMIIDAKKAAAILGQGGAIHEEARQLKVERAEFDEYLKETRAKQEGMLLAMEFTVQPKLQQAYDEIIRTQGYQSTFQQQLAQTQDPGQRARIQASIQQNEAYIQQQQQLIGQLRPAVDQFYDHRRQQVEEILTSNRKAFKDKELKNEYVYNEIREKVAKGWRGAQEELIPGVKNIDLISSDEHLLGLIRDGLKFRDRPQTRQAGASIAVLQTRKGTSVQGKDPNEDISKLREQARGGDKKAADNLLVAQLNRLRSTRRG
jgi:hypothetical protein